MIGLRLLHYEITDKLGEGGMGVVFKARDTHLDRFVAIKLLPPDKVADATRKARFIQEAKAASALNHPNIVTIYDISSDSGTDFIAMEYVAGKTLDQIIPRKGMRLNEALKIAVQITDALARAHSAGIVHRDLKPSNIMADTHGQVKVLDFGLAKLTEQAISEDEATHTMRARTDEGAIVGTAAYMSPEQAGGQPVDARADVFSFGAVLYEMVTGHRAFQGDSRMSTLAAVIQSEPPSLPEDLPPELHKVIGLCLRKAPTRRYHHMEDLRVVLEDLKEESESGAFAPSRATRRSRRRLLAMGTGLAIVAAAAVSGLWWSRKGGHFSEADSGVTVRPFTAYPGTETDPALSPDGNQVAFAWDGEKQDNFDIYVQSIDVAQPMRLTMHPFHETRPAWSPDGRWIAFCRTDGTGHDLMLTTPFGKGERKVARLPLNVRPYSGWVPPLCWTPDSRWLVVSHCETQACALFLQAADGGESLRLTSPPPGSYGDFHPAISSDGKHLAFVRYAGGATGNVLVLPLGEGFRAHGEARPVTPRKEEMGQVAWIAGGSSELLFQSNVSLWRTATKGGGEPRRLGFVDQVRGFSVGALSAQAGRRRIVYSQGMNWGSIWRAQLTGGEAKNTSPARWLASTRNDFRPQYSPDGKRVSFISDRSGAWEVWVSDADGGNPSPLTSLEKFCEHPRWSPDGNWIAFDSNAEGTWEVFVVRADGGKPRRVTAHHNRFRTASGPSWSRDGRWIYFSSPRSGTDEIWKVSASGGEAVQVTKTGGYFGLESPDGKTLYYTKDGRGQLWRTSVEGGPGHPLPGPVFLSGFDVGRDGIWYFPESSQAADRAVMFLDFATGTVRTRSAPLGRVYDHLSISPDGRQVMYSRTDRSGCDLMLVENFR